MLFGAQDAQRLKDLMHGRLVAQNKIILTLTLTLTLTPTPTPTPTPTLTPTLKVLRAEQDHRRALPGGQVQQEVQAGVVRQVQQAEVQAGLVTTKDAPRRSYQYLYRISLRPRRTSHALPRSVPSTFALLLVNKAIRSVI